MTTTIIDRINTPEREDKVRTPSSILDLSRRALTLVSQGQIAFEASMIRLTTRQEDLQYAADRGAIDPQVQKRLIARQVISPPWETPHNS